ncbi:hypothetical protein [Microbispora bryophytorum]|uniref:hypothetical protein n=1 Tax=Microbispora bryophytorum TaxID=1460882 RepID=UPI0033EF3324
MAAVEDIDIFCRAVKARSREHHEAMHVALERGWWAIAGCVLRMEIDSLIRVIYLLKKRNERKSILESWVAGKGFSRGRGYIADRDMIKIATRVNDWVNAAYEFGNKFVHLTDAHDYAEVDPFPGYEYKDEIIEYLNKYHQGKVDGHALEDSSTLRDVAAYVPHVLDKITLNLNIYLDDLRAEVGKEGRPPAARSTSSMD